MKKFDFPHTFRGFTLIELLVVISIVAILASLLMPVLTSAMERGKAVKDLNNMRQIGAGLQLYLGDNSNTVFTTGTSGTWVLTDGTNGTLYPNYLNSLPVFKSPFDLRPTTGDNTQAPISYSFNQNVLATGTTSAWNGRMSSIVSPTNLIILAPSYPLNTGDPTKSSSWGDSLTNIPKNIISLPSGGGSMAKGIFGGGEYTDVLHADGHAEIISWTTFQDTSSSVGKLRWLPLGQ